MTYIGNKYIYIFIHHRIINKLCILRKSKGWQVRSCGSGTDSWTGRQWQFLQSQYTDKYSSHNMYLHSKSLSTWLVNSSLMDTFKEFLGDRVFFDDPRLTNSSAVHLIHAWMLAVQQYKELDTNTRHLLFLEGLPFLVPTNSPTGIPTAETITSGREAG